MRKVESGRQKEKRGYALSQDNVLPEIQNCFRPLEKIESKKSFNRALGREIVADDVKGLGLKPQTREFWDGNNWRDDRAAPGCDFRSIQSMNRIYSHTQCRFKGNKGSRRSRINGHSDKYRRPFAPEPCHTDQEPFLSCKRKFFQRVLECSGNTLWERVLRIRNENRTFSFERKEPSVNLVAMRAVGQQTTGQWGGRGLVDLIDLDKQPFPMESLFNRFDFLRHFVDLATKYTHSKKRCQRRPRVVKHTMPKGEEL